MAECDGKYQFKTLRAAEKATFHLWASDPRLKIGDLRAYECPRCKKFHVGHWEYYENKKRKNNMVNYPNTQKQPAPEVRLPVEPQNTIAFQLRRLSERREALANAIERLNGRLSPILTPIAANDTAAQLVKSTEYSPVVMNLSDEADSIDSLYVWVENLIERLEV